MLRPSPNHGTQRLPNDDDDEYVTICAVVYKWGKCKQVFHFNFLLSHIHFFNMFTLLSMCGIIVFI